MDFLALSLNVHISDFASYGMARGLSELQIQTLTPPCMCVFSSLVMRVFP